MADLIKKPAVVNITKRTKGDNKIDTVGLSKITRDQVERMEYAFLLAPDYSAYNAAIKVKEEDKPKLKRKMARLIKGHRIALITKCPGAKDCSRSHKCPLAELNAEPVGEPCYVEEDLMYERTLLYAEHYGVRDSDIIKLDICQNLAELDVQEWRQNVELSRMENSSMVSMNVVGWDEEQGIPIESEQISNHYKIKDNINRQRLNLHRIMMGTPEKEFQVAQAVVQARTDSSVSEMFADLKKALLEQAASLEYQNKFAGHKTIDAEYEEADSDGQIQQSPPENTTDTEGTAGDDEQELVNRLLISSQRPF